MKRGEFTRAVFDKLHIPLIDGRLEFGVAWAVFEGTAAKNNPWATTFITNGCTKFNDDGVKNYPTFEDGVNATVATLLLVPYSHLLSELRDPNSSMRDIRGALNASPWGSKVSLDLWHEVVASYDKYNVEVPGSGKDIPVPTVGGSNESIKVESDGDSTASTIPTKDESKEVVPEVPVDNVDDSKENIVSPVDDSVDSHVDTLEDRVAAQEAAEKVEVSPVEETKSPTDSTVEASSSTLEDDGKELLSKLVDFLNRVKKEA